MCGRNQYPAAVPACRGHTRAGAVLVLSLAGGRVLRLTLTACGAVLRCTCQRVAALAPQSVLPVRRPVCAYRLAGELGLYCLRAQACCSARLTCSPCRRSTAAWRFATAAGGLPARGALSLAVMADFSPQAAGCGGRAAVPRVVAHRRTDQRSNNEKTLPKPPNRCKIKIPSEVC